MLSVAVLLLLPLVAVRADYPNPNMTFVPEGDLNSTSVPSEAVEAFCEVLLQSPLPPDQIPWYCICSHCKGTKGPKGDRGDRGLTGPPGSSGPRGVQGSRGPQGFVGSPGIKGQKGDDGIKGALGPQGAPGPKGAGGFKGEKGDPGLEGPPGDQGPKGDDGMCPDACDASQGPPGPPGPAGPAGLRGIAGAEGSKGQKGAKGESGESGVPGTDGTPGVKGDLGPKGDCDCVDGVDGAPGNKGDQGPKGEKGEAGLVGDQGVSGEKGDMGAMGMPGAPGPCMPTVKSAFSAGLTASFPPPGLPVAFSKVFYNVQNSYIPSMGVYVAPINGTYVFTFTLTVSERVLKVGLFHNFDTVLKTTDTSALGSVSQTVVLHMTEGDAVWLQVKDVSTNGMYAGPEVSSMFSGYLLYPDKCQGDLLDMGIGMGRENGDYGMRPTAPPPTFTPTRQFTWNDDDD
ncbi:otolin-1 [Periophthalmus magnuspinnatus]|uniref:otolin-1 n=1 Tax=Periophthalmus magnuspinnatus TaxID=409849 RepID=UPI00145B34D0|nr:otolin-1 [Periophthalmus magnuspinnatus]